jgi:hypothetical protein
MCAVCAQVGTRNCDKRNTLDFLVNLLADISQGYQKTSQQRQHVWSLRADQALRTLRQKNVNTFHPAVVSLLVSPMRAEPLASDVPRQHAHLSCVVGFLRVLRRHRPLHQHFWHAPAQHRTTSLSCHAAARAHDSYKRVNSPSLPPNSQCEGYQPHPSLSHHVDQLLN